MTAGSPPKRRFHSPSLTIATVGRRAVFALLERPSRDRRACRAAERSRRERAAGELLGIAAPVRLKRRRTRRRPAASKVARRFLPREVVRATEAPKLRQVAACRSSRPPTTRRSGSRERQRPQQHALTTLKMAVLAPMPSARMSDDGDRQRGALRSVRAAYLRSFIGPPRSCAEPSPIGAHAPRSAQHPFKGLKDDATSGSAASRA